MTTARDRSNELAALLRNEQGAMADFLLNLADFDAGKMWRDLGHASLFSYLRRELGLSAGAAQYRKTAAELIQRFPEVESALRAGRLCLSSVIEVAKVLTPENRNDVLPRFFGLSRREAEMVAASIRPAESIPLRDVVTYGRPHAVEVRAPAASPQPSLLHPASLELRPAETNETKTPRAGDLANAAPEPLPSATPPARDSAEPLDGEVSRFHVTVTRTLLAKLEAAKHALAHAMPGATAGEILEAGLDLLLEKAGKRRGLVEKPRKEPSPSKSDAVPAHVRRAVWLRSGGRCEWRLESGEVCGSTHQLELDHHPIPRAHNGPSTEDNIRVHCRPHNLLGARRLFGDACMDRYMGRQPGQREGRPMPKGAPP
jgi:hypothetical protein